MVPTEAPAAGLLPGGFHRMVELDEAVQAARAVGALYHPTHPFDAWFCPSCDVFGRGNGGCWSCGGDVVERQWLPRFGGGAETVIWPDSQAA